MTKRIRYAAAVLLALCLLSGMLGISPSGVPHATLTAQDLTPDFSSSAKNRTTEQTSSWIVRWKNEAPLPFFEESAIVSNYPEARMTVARPLPGEDSAVWTQRWKSSDDVLSIEENQVYQIAKLPNDPMQSTQKYLKQIHAAEAWEYATGNEAITIALIDTGVDLTHPDLVPNLVQGVNLIRPGMPPADDNGHGTNVAGVVAAASNNDKGIAGLLWRAKVMPIKALEADGTGDEDKLGEGIRYAVDHGAKIVVLSLGLNKPSAYMESVVQYAEDNGVLLVAASGNEGNSVKYPAAYPTVLAVGGVTADNQASALSNYGPELDVVAPWSVFTTAMGGKYNHSWGTSLAAPQVAAVCALAWNKYPQMKPYEIRNLIRQTAEDLGTRGWDSHTGYGLLRADLALAAKFQADPFESNNKGSEATIIPIDKRIDAQLSSGKDEDWFVFSAPYAGTVEFQLEADRPKTAIELTHYKSYVDGGTVYKDAGTKKVTVSVSKGENYIRLRSTDLKDPLGYHLIPKFHIYADAFESNDQQYTAYTLPNRSQILTGTFHQVKDQDWYVMHIDQPGSLQLKVSVDTARMDPTIFIQKKGKEGTLYDTGGSGEDEIVQPMEIQPGTYFFRVSNIGQYIYPVRGEYTLDIEYTSRFMDPNEPNDKPYEASVLLPEIVYAGAFDSMEDEDWFALRLSEASKISIELSQDLEEAAPAAKFYDRFLNPVDIAERKGDNGNPVLSAELDEGLYYLKLISQDLESLDRKYSLLFTAAKK